MSGPPDAAQYETLIEKLSKIEQRAAAGEIDALNASHDALCAVIGFLHADVRVGEREAARPLNQLQFAIFDRLRGAKPKLLFGPRDRKGATGAPTYTSAVVLRSVVNVGFFVLHKYGGMSKDEAAKWLAPELARYRVKQPNGKAITERAIIRWGAERGGKSLKGSDKVFALLIQDRLRPLLEKLPPDTPIRRAQKAAGVVVCIGRLCGL
jgi:hypothetical protein